MSPSSWTRRTGHILALADAPTFDPNDPGAASAADRGNRALSDIYEPGSTSKVMTAAAAIEEGKDTPITPVTVPPVLLRAGHVFHDDVAHGTEHLTLTGVLAKSSNLGTILTAEKVGPDKLYSYLKKFGVGDPTAMRFPGESSGILPPPAQWSGSQFYTIAFGQGLSVNAVQAASIYATIANNGVRVEPTLVAGTTAPDGTYTPAAAEPRRSAWSARGPRSTSGGCSSRWCPSRAPRRWPRSAAIGSQARPVRRTGSATPATATAATPRRSSAWRPPTTRASSSR